MRAGFMIVALVAATQVGAQGMYRWVDQNGKVHYSDKAPPPAAASAVEQKQLRGNVVETSLPGFEAQQAARNFPATLYTAPHCGDPCDGARRLLTERGVPFREVTVADNEQRDALVKLAGVAEVPVMTLGKQVHKGFERATYTGALDMAGYPRVAVPGRNVGGRPAEVVAPAPASAKKAPEPKKGPYAVE